MTPEQQSCLEWIRSRPTEIQELMKKFPPSCKVRAVATLHVPGPGRLGVISSYCEDGCVSVVDFMVWAGFEQEPRVRAMCPPGSLEVVEYLGNMTPEWVERVLAGEDLPPIWEN